MHESLDVHDERPGAAAARLRALEPQRVRAQQHGRRPVLPLRRGGRRRRAGLRARVADLGLALAETGAGAVEEAEEEDRARGSEQDAKWDFKAGIKRAYWNTLLFKCLDLQKYQEYSNMQHEFLIFS